MKTTFLSLIAFLLFTANLSAQKAFEGKITYKMEYEGAMAAQMQMAAPSGMTYQIKGTDTRMEMQGGVAASMFGIMIIKTSEKMVYIIKSNEKKAYKMLMEKQAEPETKPIVTKEDEVIEILGYKCQKYKVLTSTQGQEMTQYIWATKDINVSKPEGGQALGNNMHIEGVEGFPLKTQTIANTMGMEIISNTVVTEISTKKAKKTDFSIPKGYEIVETTLQEYLAKLQGGF